MKDETPEEAARQWEEAALADARQQPEFIPQSQLISELDALWEKLRAKCLETAEDWDGDHRRDGGK